MANENNQNKIIILPRNNYDNYPEPYANNIFFVRENTQTLPYIVSLYVGESKQADLYDITTELESIGDPSHGAYRTTEELLANIPEELKVAEKLFLYLQSVDSEGEPLATPYYKTFMYRGEPFNEFVSCSVEQLLPDGNTISIQNGLLTAAIELETGAIKTESGNVISDVSGVPLESFTSSSPISYSSSSLTIPSLPKNGSRVNYEFSGVSGGFTSVTITDISQIPKSIGDGTISVPLDYTALFVFKNINTIATEPINFFTNFTTGTISNKIYLLNPDVDISESTVIHAMVFNDGNNLCCIMGGYENG